MKDLFQRLKGGGGRRGADLTGPRLTLGAFGKHPGWDDHIMGIGVETETLAQVKQALYVRGIGGQIDSGAWEKLEPEKRLVGYDHTFLWLRPGHVILGQLWSSTDGKGRAKYPMVLCIDGEAIATGFMLTHLLPGLEQLREACKATTSADRVTMDCRAAQEQLRAMLGSADSRLAEATLSGAARRRFLERRELGPDRLGLLRALHELGATFASSAKGRGVGAGKPESHSRHLRLPLANDSRTEALLYWGAFFRCAVPDAVPLLLISRAGVNWMDVIIGEPASDAFFCLQASNKAMPLATEIPYELPLESRPRYQSLEARFLGAKPLSVAAATTRGPKAQDLPAPAAQASPGAASIPAKRTLPLFLIGGVVLAGLATAVWFSVEGGHSAATVPLISVASKQPAQQPQTNANNQAQEQERKYLTAMKEGQTAFDGKNYTNAIAKADVALGIKPNDSPATRLKSEAQTQITLASTTKEQEQKYLTAMQAGQTAFGGKDYINAMAKADVALGIKPNDPLATRLKSEAQTQIALAATTKEQEQRYLTTIKEGQTAFDEKNYTTSIAKADVALGIKPNDPSATKLRSEAQRLISLAATAKEQEQKYQTAMKEGQTAFDGKDYTAAIAKANVALGIKKGDAPATRLRSEANHGIDLAITRTFLQQGEYSKALELCKKHGGIDAFDTLAKDIGFEQNVFEDATNKFSQGDYSFIQELKGGSYSREKRFADLLTKAAEEGNALNDLEMLKQANNREAVKKRVADLASAGLLSKPPFEALRKWAEAAITDIPDGNKKLLQLDKEFEMYLVWFRVLKPTDTRIQTAEARKENPIVGQISPQDTDFYLKRIDYLKNEYAARGRLNENDRQKNLQKLKETLLSQ